MATSGSATSNSAGASYPNPNNLFFEWEQTGQNIAGNYTDIKFNLRARGGGDGYWTYYNNISLVVDGQSFSAGRTQAYHNQVLISGTKRIYHNNNGSRSFGINASAGIYTTATNVWLNWDWTLNNIPRAASITSANDFNDTQNPVVKYSNPAGNAVEKLQACLSLTGDTDDIKYRDISKTGTSYTFNLTEAERNVLRKAAANTTKLKVKYYIRTTIGGTNYHSSLEKTMTIVSANPKFSSFTYKDTNTTATNLTGNDQILIQGVSNLQVTIPSANKAVAQKQSTIKNYTATISGISKTANYSSSANVTISGFDTNLTAGNQSLSVKATDSRGLATAVTKTVQVLAYSKPQINASATRKANFENETTLHIEGSYSQLLIGDNAKNAIQSVKYRTKKQSTTTWGGWVEMKNLVNNNGKYSVDDDIASLDNSSSWDIQVQVVDKLNTVTTSLIVSTGLAIFRISDKDNLVYNNEQPLMVSHVGQVIMSTKLDTAAKVEALYGGKWESWGAGRVPVGVNTSDADFKTPNKTGGSKTVTLTQAQMPKHSHTPVGTGDFISIDGNGGQKFGFANGNYYSLIWKTGGKTADTGSGQAHTNLQPYQTLFMWCRIS